jgi:hypothetical protein
MDKKSDTALESYRETRGLGLTLHYSSSQGVLLIHRDAKKKIKSNYTIDSIYHIKYDAVLSQTEP